MSDKIARTKNNKKQDGDFKKKNVKHDPQEESSRAIYSNPGKRENP